jgi:hypothetical protein
MDRVVFTGPTTLWPPDHKNVQVTIDAIDSENNEMVTLSTSTTSDSADAGPPQMDTQVGHNTHVIQLEAERSGQAQSGRTYTITAMAMMSDTNHCTETFTVVVPHDRGQ